MHERGGKMTPSPVVIAMTEIDLCQAKMGFLGDFGWNIALANQAGEDPVGISRPPQLMEQTPPR